VASQAVAGRRWLPEGSEWSNWINWVRFQLSSRESPSRWGGTAFLVATRAMAGDSTVITNNLDNTLRVPSLVTEEWANVGPCLVGPILSCTTSGLDVATSWRSRWPEKCSRSEQRGGFPQVLATTPPDPAFRPICAVGQGRAVPGA